MQDAAALEQLMREAGAALEAGEFGRAELLFREIVGRNPRDAGAWNVLAVIACRSARPQEAVEHARRAHELERRNPEYLNTLGVAHAEAQSLDDAVRAFRRALRGRADYADAHYNLGKVLRKLERLSEAEQAYRRARQLAPARTDIANNLGCLLYRMGRSAEALPLLEEVAAALPQDDDVAVSSALAIRAAEGAEAACARLEAFVARNPGAANARKELARSLLALGRFEEGWREYSWRTERAPEVLPNNLAGKKLLLLPHEGLGDHLFFLRFAPGLRARGATVAFRCSRKLFGVLNGNPALDAVLAEDSIARSGFVPDLAIGIGDLPWLLGSFGTPPPLALRVPEQNLARWREKLPALGPPPYIGATWRGGTKRLADIEFAPQAIEPLFKEIDAGALGGLLGRMRGTLLVLQRLPARAELDAFSRAAGRPAHDLSALNESLEDMAAVLALIDDYVGVSNTNMHLRAGLGKAARVLVPFPPEFRWMARGTESPWFPGFRIYRQEPAMRWKQALDELGRDLS
ncbi:MAG: hypothetical protein A3G83_15660 [Betaproteobacteria bacterium RIFCSPLOWO2_12_FULL_68_20]|nr:MAG: hypothetical protein A3G83_15660 [Betaproteobacteria bacterium RIFCSPLOWO2_12_FULL_68_20]